MTYYVTFRHGRPLDDEERRWLLGSLLKAEGRQFEFLILCILPEGTETLFRVKCAADGRPYELSRIIESAKRRTGKRVTKTTGERYAPFWAESYDRIVRDAAEFEERWLDILDSPVREGLVEDPEEYDGLWVRPRV